MRLYADDLLKVFCLGEYMGYRYAVKTNNEVKSPTHFQAAVP